MIWWYLILGISTLAVVCAAIALYVRLRRHLEAPAKSPESGETASSDAQNDV
jgi:hypothetical protein